ncbi:LCP family protein [Pseudarthrobacter sp. PS3-L1]|uniref:LCP family protein n=1 Tax=Pseudarthrobacter sp. PS3-L1 TaxID=3046207 RepID=UPI0024BB730B|nr:LCP family protein [Pseudarthrobacter sp. PS3-L1]MDJ0320103.1 LCP family protein [Pseudarthrobacter sp. PS3-L1]
MGQGRDDNAQENRQVHPQGTAARHTDTTAVGGARHLGSQRRFPRWAKVVSLALAVVLVGGFGVAGYWVLRLQGNITTAPLSAGNGNKGGGANDSSDRMQILILGSDTRDGKNSEYGGDESTGYGQSDVMMLMDISADNKRVSVVSFPRDLLVDVPACTDAATGQQFPARSGAMINSAMAEAGIGCAVDTVNALTGLEVDHFMMADFNAVKELSSAVGGVDVCVSDAVYDPDSRLRLPKGTSAVQGETALAFLRTRHAFEDGGDLGRIKAQQGFLSSLTRKIKDDGTLSNPAKVLNIADVVTRNLTLDEGFASVPSLVTVGNRLKDIDVSKVAFVAVPTQAAVSDPNRLELAQPAAGQLFSALRSDLDLTNPSAEPTGAPEPSAAPSTPAAAPYDKSLQPVSVANGTGVPGRAEEIIAALAGGGFVQASVLQAAPVEQTFVYYGPEFADVAADVAAQLGVPATQVAQATGVVGVQVYLGTDFVSGTTYGATSVPPDVVNQTAEDSTCQNVNPLYIDTGGN